VHVTFTDELPGSLGWIAPEPGFMQRASHALAADGRVWLVDPVDGDGVLDRVRALGEPAGVLQLLDRHERDGPALAARLGVPYHRLPAALPGTPFQLVPVLATRLWRELALWWPERRVLLCPESLGTADYYLAPGERLAVHPLRRLAPPRALRPYAAEHVLVGHGAGVHGDAAEALRAALDGARRRLPAFLAARARRPRG
jgi:hypothetical protein